MKDKQKLAEERERGEHAKNLREDPMLVDFFAKVEAAAFAAIKSSSPDQGDLRERAYFQLEALENLRVCFQNTINTGKFAAEELQTRRGKE